MDKNNISNFNVLLQNLKNNLPNPEEWKSFQEKISESSIIDHVTVASHDNLARLLPIGFSIECFKNKKCVYEIKLEDLHLIGNEQEALKNIEKAILDVGLIIISKIYHDGHHWDDTSDKMEITNSSVTLYLSNDVFVKQSIVKIRDFLLITCELISSSEEKLNTICAEIQKHCERKPEGANLYVVTQKDNELNLKSLGRPASKFINSNYSKSVIDEFEYVVDQLKKRDPDGRLTIIHGVPGSGKTYFLRGLMDRCYNQHEKIVFFQPDLFKSFKITDIVTLFLNSIKSAKDSLILFIEDGDECLLTRSNDNMDAISNMLNIADGLIGNILDIKIVVTSNAKKMDIDSALKRPGRLCRIIEIDELEPDQAGNIFKRLTGKSYEFKKKATLAEVYSLAGKHEQMATIKE